MLEVLLFADRKREADEQFVYQVFFKFINTFELCCLKMSSVKFIFNREPDDFGLNIFLW